MRMNGPVVVLCLAALAACTTPMPESNPDRMKGPGFDDYSTYRRAPGPDPAPAATIAPDPLRIAEEAPSEPEAIAGDAMAALGAEPEPPAPPAPAPVAPAPEPVAAPAPAPTPAPSALTPVTPVAAGAPLDARRTGLSDEQDFEAVAARETIESDAERLARQREARQVIVPTEVPDRGGAGGPNIVQFAISTRNNVGESMYSRSPFAGAGRAARVCARYPSDDLAQEAFLEAGGPGRDRMGIDPDGDGFACAWDPAPFRRAAAAARN